MVTITALQGQQKEKLDRYFMYAGDRWDFLHRLLSRMIEKYDGTWEGVCTMDIAAEELSPEDFFLLNNASTWLTITRTMKFIGISAKETDFKKVGEQTYQLLIIL